MSKPFTAYWNVPGYLPDVEPVDFDTKDEALRYLADEIWAAFRGLPKYLLYYDTYQARTAACVDHLYAHGWTTYDGTFYGIGE